jgi:hypothetical protein
MKPLDIMANRLPAQIAERRLTADSLRKRYQRITGLGLQ